MFRKVAFLAINLYQQKIRGILPKMADSAKEDKGNSPDVDVAAEPPAVPLVVMDMVQRSNGNGAGISIVDLGNRPDGGENVVGLIAAPNGGGDVTNGKGRKLEPLGSVATDEGPGNNGASITLHFYQGHFKIPQSTGPHCPLLKGP